MCIQFGTQIEDPTSFEQEANRLRTTRVFAGPREQESFEGLRIDRRRPGSWLSPVAVPVPGNKADQGVVHFFDESPDPVEPERLKAVNARSSNSRPSLPRAQPLLNRLRR